MNILIIGQGLAGSVLALHMIRSGHAVTVVDPYLKNTCSRIAAGVMKPVTGQRIVRSWNADVLIAEALLFYREIEELTGMKLLHSKPMLQLFMSNGNRNDWMGRLSQPEIAKYHNEELKLNLSDDKWDFTYGGIYLNSCYQLNISGLIDICSEYIDLNGKIIRETAEPSSL
jgi:glycine/D-amino acid oxidase-like deaminating enzyme